MTRYNFNFSTSDAYDYRAAMCDDIRDYLDERGIETIKESERDDIREKLYDEMWTADSITGNGSGSYTFNTWKAEECLCHNLDLLAEACEEFGGGCDILKDGAEACDVTIRCYLLGQILDEIIDERIVEDEDDDENDDDENI